MRKDFVNFVKSLKILLINIYRLVRSVVLAIFNFFRPYEQSIKGIVSPEEFYRIIILALSAGGGFDGFVTYLKNNFQQFITDPNIAIGIQAFVKHCVDKNLTVLIIIVIFIGEYLRRKYHGVQG